MAFQNIQHVDDLITVDARLIEAKIISRIVHLKNVHQVAPITIAGYLAAIMFFYAMNDITLNKRKISKYLPSGEERMRIGSRIKNQNTCINQSSSSAKDSISSSSLATISSSSSSSTRSSSSMSSSFSSYFFSESESDSDFDNVFTYTLIISVLSLIFFSCLII